MSVLYTNPVPSAAGSVDSDPNQSPVLPTLPLFNPATGADTSGLALLAAAATQQTAQPLLGITNPTPPAQTGNLHQPGPYAPTASLPAKVVKRILNLEYVEMSEITLDDVPLQSSNRSGPPRLPITDISQWIERYSTLAAIIATRFPHKAAELFAYQAIIVRAERNYETHRWVSYDRQFRREALARKDLNWSNTQNRFYNEAFTGRARQIARCTFCLQDDHTSDYCPRNPNRSLFGLLQDATLWPSLPRTSQPPQHNIASGYQPAGTYMPTSGYQHTAPYPPATGSTSQEICRRFNRGRCNSSRCRYSHACQECFGPHSWQSCPRNVNKGNGRSRSPQRPSQRGNGTLPYPPPQRY